MALTFSTVTLGTDAIGLNTFTEITVVTTGVPNGTFHGVATVGDYGAILLSKGSNVYKALIPGYRVHRQTTAPFFIVIADDDGPVEYTAVALDLTVTGSENYFPRPVKRVQQWIWDEWDTAMGVSPNIKRTRDLRSLSNAILQEGVVAIKEGTVKTDERGRGDYKDNEYPVTITVYIEGTRAAEDIYENMVSEVKRIIGLKWYYISEDEFDFIRYDDDGYDMSDESVGRFQWVWNVRLMAPMRGRTTSPATPHT